MSTQREIKFRAWDRKLQMWASNGWHLENTGRLMLHSGPADVADTDYVVMQYTGLRDKNGKELYFDSDLCKLKDGDRLWYAAKDDFGIPCWLPADGAFGVCLPFDIYFLDGHTGKDAFEIMGNRFENPDLIP